MPSFGSDQTRYQAPTGPAPTGRGPVATRRRSFDLERVRRRDVRRLREAGPPWGVRLPARHGHADDPRYPSSTTARQVLAFLIDVVLHAAVAAAAFVEVWLATDGSGWSIVAALVGFVVASVLHRIVVQRLAHATLGKALTGLCVIADDTGGPPTLWSLVKEWFAGAIVTVLAAVDS